MFTGIIESTGQLRSAEKRNENIEFWIESTLAPELKPDQSLAHDGVCLTVEEISDNAYRITAIAETLDKTTLKNWIPGAVINLERCVKANGRLDGHIVQGHVDTTAEITEIENQGGSYMLHFKHDPLAGITVKKGSVCINGISLTVVNSETDSFSVAIIPYTWEHTNIKFIKTGDRVNVEFDILGKYLQKINRR